MLQLVGQLFTPLRYLRIENPQKRWFDVWFPLGITALAMALLVASPWHIKIFGVDGLIAAITGLLQILIGFFIASLAAVATFQRPGLDATIEGTPASLKETRRGRAVTVSLTRRKFLCYLFGYLALVGIILYFAGELAILLASDVKVWTPQAVVPLVKWSAVALYLFATANVFVTTLLGLHYMTDRIHRDNHEAIEKHDGG